jgi:transcriptional regulator with XRE-family HTH domain
LQIPRLRGWRELRGWTQKDLAEESGVSARSIAGYETGASIRPRNARKLAEALDVEVADLVVTSGKGAAPPSLEPSFNDVLDEERRQWRAEVDRCISEAEEVLHAPDLTQDVAYQIVQSAAELLVKAADEKNSASREEGYTFKEINDITRAYDRIMEFSGEANQVFLNRFGESAEAQKARDHEKRRLKLMKDSA